MHVPTWDCISCSWKSLGLLLTSSPLCRVGWRVHVYPPGMLHSHPPCSIKNEYSYKSSTREFEAIARITFGIDFWMNASTVLKRKHLPHPPFSSNTFMSRDVQCTFLLHFMYRMIRRWPMGEIKITNYFDLRSHIIVLNERQCFVHFGMRLKMM